MAMRPSRRRAHRRRGAVLAVVVVVLGAACGGGGGPSDGAATGTPTTAITPGDIDPTLLQPLTMLGPCTAEPNVLDEEPVDGAVLPPGAVMTSQETDGPLTTIKGYVAMTPIQVRVYYQRQDEYDVLQVEDEIQESETLLGNGNHRLFVKAQAICELGSVLLMVVAPEAEGAQVPAPAGATPGS